MTKLITTCRTLRLVCLVAACLAAGCGDSATAPADTGGDPTSDQDAEVSGSSDPSDAEPLPSSDAETSGPATSQDTDTPPHDDASPDTQPDTQPDTDGPGDDPPTGFVAPGVGVMEAKVPNEFGDSMKVIIWYPAVAPEPHQHGKTYLWVLEGIARESATPLPGEWPVILFSHGSQAIPEQSINLVEAWAQGGYIVAAPTHIGNTLFDNSADAADIAQQRPRDLVATRQALNAFSADPEHRLHGRVDDSRVAVAGHSFGGMTTLFSAGAAVDVVGAKAACASGANLRGACDLIEDLEGELHFIRPPELEDVKAAIALSPAFHVLFGEIGLAQITAPTFIGVGALDAITPAPSDGWPIYQDLPDPRAIAHFFHAGHYAFSNFCDVPDIETLSKGAIECDPDAFTDPHDVMAITAELTLPWLDAHVLGHAGRTQVLAVEEELPSWPDVLEVEIAE